ncbi:xanthine dehydrogenase family protein molybdopterin-binding subunit [Candidatus Formimonas warabiya]|uniref:Aldehyde oxidase/xanthine dehydrogenase a/b hammerhead domain-containing protein n=1 Tax=Formimonas warabiya TaxID=1761012 RepID=A0A3G1KY79_FORW1|nr:xanthine dehydrogenase family protein molybdopterin-binding subunit [Candidatus Formimonas warabiya]ATW27165.1 hypothetical protein DCMF_22600 [Candidatus Formimonas warabiya]
MMEYVGHNLLKADAPDKVTGKAKFVADLSKEGMLWAAAVRSPYAHAKITAVSVEDASACPGVRAVLTARDIPGINAVSPTGVEDQPVLAEDKVRFFGEAVALVVADSLAAARKGAALIRVDYQPLPVVESPEESLQTDSPKIHDQGNLCQAKKLRKGDFAEAEKQADLLITNTYRTHAVDHGYLEPDACFADWVEGKLIVRTTTKSAHHDQHQICRVLGLPSDRVRVIAAVIGGSFGGKADMPLICMTSLAAWKTGCPVKIVYSREECLQTTTKRHPCIVTFTHAVRKDGRILGVKGEILLDAGAYSGYSSSVLGRSLGNAVGPYAVEHIEIDAKAVFTNNPSSGAMRGYGTPQMCFGHEGQMDQIAEQLGLNPWDVRLINALKPGDDSATGQMMREDIKFQETILAAREKAGTLPQGNNPLWIKKGWGVACFWYGNGRTGLPNPGLAHGELNPDGTITFYVGSPDIGQGSNTVFRQVAAEALHISPQKINVVSADTLLTPDSGTTSGTRLTFIVANGVKRAAEDLLLKITDFQKKEGLAGCLPKVMKTLGRLAGEKGILLRGEGRFDPPTVPPDNETGQGIPYGTYTLGTQYVELTLNLLTGRVQVDRIIASYDCGVVVNPVLFQGQLDGGTAQGIGYALLEELGLKKGKVQNDNFDRYLMATSMDVGQVDAYTVPNYDQLGPFGAKGIGEPATIPTAAAIINAINRATEHKFRMLPVIPETLVAAGRSGAHGRS